MKGLSAGIKIGILVLLGTVIGYATYKSIGTPASGKDGYQLSAKFRDATGLPSNSRVVIAGLPVGEIVDRDLSGRYALLEFRVRKDAVIYDNAVVSKKSSSLLGEFYLDIDPGTPKSVTEDGAVVMNERVGPGDELKFVKEAATTDDLIRTINDAVPVAVAALAEAEKLFADARAVVNGPIKDIAEGADQVVAENRQLLHDIMVRTDRAMASFERVGTDLAYVTGDSKESLVVTIKNAEQVSADLKELVAVTQGEITMTGEKVREKLDRVDATLDGLEGTFGGTNSIVRKIDEEEGTLGRLVNDPQIADNFESITTDVAGFVKSAFGLQTVVGVRSEWNFVAAAAKSYFSLELQPRPDKYYLIELVDDPRGTITQEFVLNGQGQLVAATTVDRSLRFTFQFAKKFGNFTGLSAVDDVTVRLGIKENTGGVGVDGSFLGGHLVLNADLFDYSFDKWPRVKLQAALNFFKYLYIYGGVDDVLNKHDHVTVVGDTTVTGKDIEYHFGRDYFGGAMLRFNDKDMSALLFIGGAALGAIAGGG